GDGINDAAALREADVGISVDTAVDVAKESADIVMLEKSLTVLVDVVIEGRRNSANIVKYIKMAASSNFTTMAIATIGAILPFTAIGSAIGLVRLPPVYFFWLAGILVSYCLVVQTVKIWFLKQFKAWI